MLTWPECSKNGAWALRLRGRDAPVRAKCLSGLLLGEPERQRLTDPGRFLQGRPADRIRQEIFQCDAEDPAGRSKGSSCEAAPEGRTRGVLSVRSTRRGASPPFRNLPPGFVAPAKPALESGTLSRGRRELAARISSQITSPSDEGSTSSAGFARATDSWGRLRRGPPRPPPMKRRRWALIIALAARDEPPEQREGDGLGPAADLVHRSHAGGASGPAA